MALRDFLYLDRALVRDFLAQAEGGQIDEEKSRSHATGSVSGGLQIGVNGLGAKAAASKGGSSETEMVIRQVGPSEFERLYNYLDSSDDLTLLETVDSEEELAPIRRQRFIEVDGRVKAAGLNQLLSLFVEMGSAMRGLKALGTDVSIDDETSQVLAAADQLGGAVPQSVLILTVPGSIGFKVGLELKPDFILASDWDVEATALVKVQRVLRQGESRVLGDPFGGLLSKVPQAQLDEMIRGLTESEAGSTGLIPDIELRAPAIIATPIAIYR